MTQEDRAAEMLMRLKAAFRGESDRSAAIVAAAMLETSLVEVVQRLLLPVTSGARGMRLKFFGETIGVAEQLGLISSTFAHDLGRVNEIRNYFAHHPFEASFNDEKVVKLVEQLRKNYFEANPEKLVPSGPRADYISCVSWMLFSLNTRVGEVSAVESPVKEFGYWNQKSLAAGLKALGVSTK
jgi:hypothetical protein